VLFVYFVVGFMTFLNGITVLLIFQLIGEVGVHTLDLLVPGPVLGMFLLFICLLIRGTLPESLDTAATGLLRHFSLLFIPAGVGSSSTSTSSLSSGCRSVSPSCSAPS